MHHHYRKSHLLPLFFSGLLGVCACLFAPPAVAADLAPILPQFVEYSAPKEMVDLAFVDASGKTKKLSDFRGQLVLVNLWATWCLPCRHELPALDHLQTVFKDAKFLILPISLDDPNDAEKISAFFKSIGIQSLQIYKNPDFPLLKRLHPDGLPASYLLTPDGKAVGSVEGYASWDSAEAANLIEAYLDKTSAKKNRQARRVSKITSPSPIAGAIRALANAA